MVLLGLSAALLFVLPRQAPVLPPGFRTPILAFEFARTHGEIEALFGAPGSEVRARLVRAMDLGNRIDFAFMVAYGAFLTCFGVAVARVAGRRYGLVAILAAIAAAADAAENRQLFAITRALGGEYDDALARLSVFTWVKWGALAIALAWLSPWLLGGKAPERVTGGLAVITAVLALCAFAWRGASSEAFSFALSLTFVGLFVVAVRLGRAW